jgi:nucleoside-diphosphate-sugar epimerase
MKILVTGGTGYVGSKLFDFLTNLDADFYYLPNREALKIEGEKTNRSYLDVASSLIREYRPDLTIHLAAYYTRSENSEEISKLIESNIKFGTVVLDAIPIKSKFIFFGSYMQVFPIFAHELYPLSRNIFGEIVDYYSTYKSLSSSQVILFDVYGPDDKRNKLIPNIIKALKSYEEFTILNPLNLIYPIYVFDVLDSIKLLLNREMPGTRENHILIPNSSIKAQDLFNYMRIRFENGRNVSPRVHSFNEPLPDDLIQLKAETPLHKGLHYAWQS